MEKKDILKPYSHQYVAKCDSCDEIVAIRSTRSEDAERIVPIYVECECGEYVEIELQLD